MSKPKPKLIAPKGSFKPNIIVINPAKGKKLPVKNLKAIQTVIPAKSTSVITTLPIPVPSVAASVEINSEVEEIDLTSASFTIAQAEELPDNECCRDMKTTIQTLTLQNRTLKENYNKIVKAHDSLKNKYILLENKYKEKVEECNRAHNVPPPVLSVSKYIELF